VILRCFHQSVPRCRSKLQEQREPAKCKCWQRKQRSGAGLLVKCLPTAWSPPVPPQRFRHVRFKGSCRDCTIVPARLKASRCPQWTCDIFSVSWATSSAIEFHLRNLLRLARESGRDGWPVAATAWLAGRGRTADFAHAQCRCDPANGRNISWGKLSDRVPVKVANASRRP
jgi:hypothetical protein